MFVNDPGNLSQELML